MSVDVTPNDALSFDVGDAVAAFRDGKFVPSDESFMSEAVFVLKRLANNRNFLADLIENDLKDGFSGQEVVNP